jgi:hypothetical protein
LATKEATLKLKAQEEAEAKAAAQAETDRIQKEYEAN